MIVDPIPRPKRGLSALLASTTQGSDSLSGASAPTSSVTLVDIPIASIRPNINQPRALFDPEALAELVASIKSYGLVQPIVVRQLKAEESSGEIRYELIAGERRWRAAQIAGLSILPAIMKPVFDQRDILLLSLIENLQRDDLNSIEEALAYDRLARTFNLTHDQIADGVGKKRASISNTIRLLELPTSIQEALKTRRLSIGHAKVLLGILDPKLQSLLAAKVQAENLTVRDLERLIAGAPIGSSQGVPDQVSNRKKGSRATRVAPPNIQDIERQLREHFGTRVQVIESLRKGRIIVEFYSVEDFERITQLMGLATRTE
ncbi:MAG: ParB/RepB/Spo0J family partition protein [Planctomycetota bacterium]